MEKTNLLLIIMFSVLMVLVLPTIFATRNTITEVVGNDTALTFVLTTTQISTNPKTGENISYSTNVNVSCNLTATYNLTSFVFNLPDNMTTSVLTDFVLRNASASNTQQVNGTTFTAVDVIDYNSISLSATFLNNSANLTSFNITWKLESPISSTKIAATRSGRAWTETWNYTNVATNTTISNASLVVTPIYWYTRIGNPTVVQFNSTTKTYSANYTGIEVWTDLNFSASGSEPNLDGAKSGILNLVYNGPIVDTSSGGSPSGRALSILPEGIAFLATPLGIFSIIVGILIVAGLSIGIVVLVKRR